MNNVAMGAGARKKVHNSVDIRRDANVGLVGFGCSGYKLINLPSVVHADAITGRADYEYQVQYLSNL